MKDSVIFLGTGGDAIVVGKQLRASGGIVVVADENQFLIDPGPGSLVRARQAGVSFRENVAVLVSHSHLNHSCDAEAAISSMTYNGMDRHGLLLASEKAAARVRGFYKECLDKCITLKDLSRIGINEVEVRPIPVKHSEECFGFVLTGSRFSLGYTSDTEYSQSVAKAFSDLDVLIVNCKHPSGVEEKGHLNAERAAYFLKQAKPKLGVITHFGVKALKEDPLSVAREVQRLSGVRVMAAQDGLALDPNTFSAKVRQKKLSSFKSEKG